MVLFKVVAVMILINVTRGCLKLVPDPNFLPAECVQCNSRSYRTQARDIEARNFFGLLNVQTTTPCCLGTGTNTDVPPMTGCKCGVKKSGTRIINGQETEVNEYPWMAILQFANSGSLRCGGIVVASQFVMTAAHCVTNIFGTVLSASRLEVVLGEHDRDSTTETDIRKVFSLDEIIVHPDYQGNNNDIALVKLSEEADLSVYTPICLPMRSFDATGRTGIATGWGVTEDGSISNVLREVDLPIVSDQVCQASFASPNIIITDQMVCAGGNLKDTCQGDSGGPISVVDNNQFKVVGITSFGVGCAEPDSYGVYAEVAKLRSWVNEQFAAHGGATLCMQ